MLHDDGREGCFSVYILRRSAAVGFSRLLLLLLLLVDVVVVIPPVKCWQFAPGLIGKGCRLLKKTRNNNNNNNNNNMNKDESIFVSPFTIWANCWAFLNNKWLVSLLNPHWDLTLTRLQFFKAWYSFWIPREVLWRRMQLCWLESNWNNWSIQNTSAGNSRCWKLNTICCT